MSESTPSYAAIIDAAIARQLASVRVMLPGRVESYDASSWKANVQPLVMETYLDGGIRQPAQVLPVCTDVPVIFPGSGDQRITFPIKRGDLVTLAFCSSSIDRLLAGDGDVVDPQDDRHHHLSDAVAFPGFFTFGDVPTSAPTSAMVLHADQIKLGGPSAAQALIKGTAYRAAEDTFHTVLKTFLTPITGPLAVWTTALSALPGMATAASAFQTAFGFVYTALVAFQSGISGSLSLSTKVDIE